ISGWLQPETHSPATYTINTTGKTEKQLAVFSASYFPQKNARNVGGFVQDERMDITGFRFNQFVTDNRYFLFEVGGAYGGEVDGYAQVLLGTGYRLPSVSKNKISTEVAVGGAGGGEVDTGGGGVVQASLALEHQFNREFGLALKGSYLHAPGGELSAPGVSLSGHYHFTSPKVADALSDNGLSSEARARHWSVSASTQRYFPLGNAWHKTGGAPANTIDLFGLALETMLTQHWYISGETLGAYRGGVGGYAVGLIGLGLRTDALFSIPLYARIQLQVGAAGGGGIDVGGGLLTQITSGLEYQFDNRFSVLVQGGRALAPNGNFEANVAGIVVSYRFTGLEL
ncbi:MAG: hypothetical protein OEY67_08360, partial [Gammaproteobacteria bacterium]|nr:hypothetical protein [Gammaproteobacteria bacterium]